VALNQDAQFFILRWPQGCVRTSGLTLFCSKFAVFCGPYQSLGSGLSSYLPIKIIVTALVSVVLLDCSYSLSQWVSLLVLSAGVTILILENKNDWGGDQRQRDDDIDDPSPKGDTPWMQHIGLVAVLAASVCSALAGVLFEKYVKRDATDGLDGVKQEPLLVDAEHATRSVFSFMRLCKGTIRNPFFERNPATATAGYGQSEFSFVSGFTKWMWILVFLRASVPVYGQCCEGVNFRCFDSLRYFGIVIHFQHTHILACATMAVTAGYIFSNKVPEFNFNQISTSIGFVILLVLCQFSMNTYYILNPS